VILWRMFTGGVLGMVLAVAAVWALSLTVIEASLAGGGLAVAGLIVGGVLDVRADGRQDTTKGKRQ
jgi:hypothetical protein